MNDIATLSSTALADAFKQLETTATSTITVAVPALLGIAVIVAAGFFTVKIARNALSRA